MKKTVLPVIIAMCFNAFASAAQFPQRAPASAQSLKMAQINQWNNMLPYAGVVLGTATIGLASWYGQKISKKKQQEQKDEAHASEISCAQLHLDTYDKENSAIVDALDRVDGIKELYKDSKRAHEAQNRIDDFEAHINSKANDLGCLCRFTGDIRSLKRANTDLEKKEKDYQEKVNSGCDESGNRLYLGRVQGARITRENRLIECLNTGLELLKANNKARDSFKKELKKLKKVQEKDAVIAFLDEIGEWMEIGGKMAFSATCLSALLL